MTTRSRLPRARTWFWSSAVAAALVVSVPATATAVSGDGEACFTERDNAALSFEVIQQAPPPVKDSARYDFYPLTGVASMQLGSLSAAKPNYSLYYFQWANRSTATLVNARGQDVVRKPNFQQAGGRLRQQRTPFSSVAQANACTLAQTANALGLTPDAERYAAAGNIRLVKETEQADRGATGPSDVCVIGTGTMPRSAAGVLLDYEVQDKRSGEEALAFLTVYTDLVHRAGRKAILLINPVNAPSQIYTGINASNAHAIVGLFDRTTIFLWSRNREGDMLASYRAQKAVIEAGGAFDGSRILIDFELMGTSLADAQLVRRLIIDDHLAGVLFWRNYAQQGGPCTSDANMKIATVAFGRTK
jgi:hypothetical protein